MKINPVLVEVTRGDMVESFHRGAAVVMRGDETLLASYGDINRPIYPRSAIKPLQAMVLVESGALKEFQLGSTEIALACASHSGEQLHVDGVTNWLTKIGLNESNLECGAQEPTHEQTRYELARQCINAGPQHNNCSGKHAGFLTIAVHNKFPVAGYIQQSHPVQQRVIQILEELTDENLSHRPKGIDGCGIPVVGITLRGIARACARIASGKFESRSRQNAAVQITDAMKKHPYLVGGSDRFCTVVGEKTDGAVLVKVGAEGVYTGITMKEPQVGIALKIDDGSRRAAEVLMGGLLSSYCSMSDDTVESLQPWFQPQVKNVAGEPVGIIRPVLK